ncbi:MAG: DUF2892 domain-containing protein [Candidatus Moranbacteria bacterium]|nr:DUF2892 domain-containing protein [Candidatus Moranbacteria bacterium]
MQKNEGIIDRLVRAALGIVIIYLAYQAFSGIGQIVGYVIGVILLVTAATGFCYLYTLLGVNTRK